MVRSRTRRAAIGRDDDVEVTKVRIRRCEEHAHVCREASENYRAHSEIVDQQIELSMVEAGVLCLEHEIIFVVGTEDLRDPLTTHTVVQHVTELLAEIRTPLSEIV